MGHSRTQSDPEGTSTSHSDYGFLHIGKTAGSSVIQLARLSAEHGYHPPTIFGHRARLPVILRRNPAIKIGFFLRDPIERVISGFQSRLRQGRPLYASMWSAEEAAAFSFFESARDFLIALVCDKDERLKSAALFAEKHITHVARNYAFHLKGPNFLQRHKDRIYFCEELGELSSTLHQLFEPCGIPKTFVDEYYVPAHGAGSGTETILASFDDDKIGALKKHFAGEYAIYNQLLGREGLSR